MVVAAPRLLIVAVAIAPTGLVPVAALGAQLRPGDGLNLTLSGFAAVQAHAGDLDNQRRDAGVSRGLDLSNDTELHILLRGGHEQAGIEYGVTIELQADTNDQENAEKTWVFVRGDLGELRLGDEEGAVEESVVGGSTVAAGTGGIDGEVIDELAVDAVLPSNTENATKIRYYTPTLGGFQLGLSFTPNADDGGDLLAAKDMEIGDWIEGALTFEGEIADAGVEASLVGSGGRVTDRDRDGTLWAYHAGAAAELGAIGLGAGFGDEDIGGLKRRYLNAGAAWEIGPVNTSLTWGRVLRTRGYDDVGEPWNVVLSADTGLFDGVVLQGDVAWFASDLDADAETRTGGDDGVVWVLRLEVAF